MSTEYKCAINGKVITECKACDSYAECLAFAEAKQKLLNTPSHEIEEFGTVEDLPTDESYSWTIEDTHNQYVRDKLSNEGFDDSDLDEFKAFLVKTNTGDITDIYAIKCSIPYLSLTAWRFKKEGVYL